VITSTPNLLEYDPREIEWQFDLIRDIRTRFDYSLGTHECLLSGSVGSGKSLPTAHLIVTHCLLYPGANFGVGRRALPKLKATLLKKIREHLFNTGVDYQFNKSSGDIELCNGSLITAFSWADGNFEKFGSYELSGMAIEEASETKEPGAYEYALSRVGRLPHVPEAIMIAATNPEAPGHWLHKRFIDEPTETRHVYYSRTEQNKFLKPQYIEGLKRNMDPKLARRLLYGEWVEINNERIYYAYESERNFKRDADYQVNPRAPIHLSFDFNIAKGKPLSVIFFQYVHGQFHFFDEIVIEGVRTLGAMEEAAARGLFDHPSMYIVNGDAAGKHSDTRSNRSDYDIIKHFLANFKNKQGQALNFKIEVPLANPSIRDRHNLVNAHCLNAAGEVRAYFYKKCKTADEGMRLTALKDNSQYIEDDSKAYQHVTTAIGYGMWATVRNEGRQAPQAVQR
jgi:hypothetical protein